MPPKKPSLVFIWFSNKAVLAPGLTPGMRPPCFFKLSAMSSVLKFIFWYKTPKKRQLIGQTVRDIPNCRAAVTRPVIALMENGDSWYH